MVNNADWLLNLNYVEFIRDVGACFSVNNMLRAECFKQRMEKGLSFLEFNYMPMQSYDFYYLFQHYGCNMQFGGNDQWSNMLGGTELIRRKLGQDAHAMTITLLLNSEGKMCIRDRNIIIIKTMPGLASAAASAVDAMNMSVVVGTLAGDDTVFLVMRDNNAAAAFCGEIKNLLA